MIKYFYPDGLIYEGDNPPARGVQVIVQSDEDGPYMTTGADYYIWREDMGGWLGVDIFGLFDFLIESGLVLFGRTISNAEYRDIFQRAKLEKNTWKRNERRP